MEKPMTTANVAFKGEFCKVSKENSDYQVAYGWAYVSKVNDEEVVDHSGDVWPIDEIEKTARQFVCDCRVGGESHIYKGGAVLVHSIVFTKEVQDALEIDLKKEGWFVGFEVRDAALLQKIQKGELTMFSIGGSGLRG
jgi:uncharacterized protein YuzE